MRLGNDTSALERLAALLSEASVRLTDASATVESMVASARWTGRDAEAFALQMRTTIRPSFLAQARRLDDAAASIRAQASAQVLVSSAEPTRPSLVPGQRPSIAPVTSHRESTVLQFDPTGDGQIVVALGDLAHARHIAVLVPGAGSALRNTAPRLKQASELLDALDAIHEPSAVIAWLGYDAPAGLASVSSLDQVLTTTKATDGAQRLSTFVSELRRDSTASVTLIGHSYGSLVAAKAAAGNANVDSLVVLGSPGLGVSSAAELDLAPGTRFFAGATLGDPISHTEWFGPDPTSPGFGAIVLDTGPGTGSEDQLANAHSAYFETSSASLANLAAVVTGRSPQIRHDGLSERSLDIALDGLDRGAATAGLVAGGQVGEAVAAGVARTGTTVIGIIEDEFRRTWRRLNRTP